MEESQPANHIPLILLFAASMCFMLAVIIWFPGDNTQTHKNAYKKIVTSAKLRQKPHVLQPTIPVSVLGVQILTEDTLLPLFTRLEVDSRRQAYNLSCEFAAASAIIYYFTRQPQFSPQNQQLAEKTLIEKMYVSQNPNIGIRMGDDAIDSDVSALYKNLNKGFGGADYYGIHAPPFFDLFTIYGLQAKPIRLSDTVLYELQKALASGHLVMAWINVGYGEKVDIALSYGGLTSVVKGEHSIVVTGYDKNGFFVMDPGNGTKKHIAYAIFFEAAKLFPLPFLDVYPSAIKEELKDASVPVDSTTGLNRKLISFRIENASDRIGAGTEIGEILKDFGYRIWEVKKVAVQDFRGVRVQIPLQYKDFLPLLTRDFGLANILLEKSTISSTSGDFVISVGN